MNVPLHLILISLVFFACKSKSKDGTANGGGQSAEAGKSTPEASTSPASGIAKQPNNIAGDLNLHGLQCDVTNHDDSNAQVTIIGCIVKNENGTKYTGDVSNVLADIYIQGIDKPVGGQVTVLSKEQQYSLSIIANNAKPSLAVSVKVNALVGGESEQWLVTFPFGVVKATLADMDLYVKASAANAGPLCLKDAPCTTITKALTFVPTEIGHKVTIHVAADSYAESLLLSGKIISADQAQLVIVGEDSNFAASPSKFFELKPPTTANAGVSVSSISDYNSDLAGVAKFQIRNAVINRGSTSTATGASIAYGVYARSSDVLLSNVQVIGGWDIAVGASFSTQMFLKDVSASGFYDAGIDAFASAQIYLQNNITLNGGSTGIRSEQQAQLFWDINSDAGQTLITISFGASLDPDFEYIGVHVLDAQAAELNQAGKATAAKIIVNGASEAIKIEHGKMIVNATDIKATGCSSHCILVTDQGLFRFQGPSSIAPISMELAAVSGEAGSLFAAENYSLIDVKDYAVVKLCNIQSTKTSPGRYAASSTISSTILTAISATLTQSNYPGCSDNALNRKVFVDNLSRVYASGTTNLAKDASFLRP